MSDETNASLSSSEINLLIQHYLQELGYDHAAFAFACESKIPKHPIAKRDVPPGSLVYLVQKGMLFCKLEEAADDAVVHSPSSADREITQLMSDLNSMEKDIQEGCEASRWLRHYDQSAYLDDRGSLMLTGHIRPVTVTAWSSNDRYLATGAMDGRVVVWETYQDYQILDRPAVANPDGKDITCMKWHDDRALLVGTFSGKVVQYDPELNEIWKICETKEPIVSIDILENAVIGDSTGNVYTIDSSGAVIHRWRQEGELVDVFWRNETSVVAAVGDAVYLMEMDKAEPLVLFKAKSRISQVILDASRMFMVVGDDAGFVAVFDFAKNALVMEHQFHTRGVCSLSFATAKPIFATGGCDGFVKLYDVEIQEESVLDGHAKTVYVVASDPLARYVATAGAEKIINVWSTESRQVAFRYKSEQNPVVQMSWSTTGNFLTMGLDNGSVALVDTRVLIQ